jgi:hypothetical protein
VAIRVTALFVRACGSIGFSFASLAARSFLFGVSSVRECVMVTCFFVAETETDSASL